MQTTNSKGVPLIYIVFGWEGIVILYASSDRDECEEYINRSEDKDYLYINEYYLSDFLRLSKQNGIMKLALKEIASSNNPYQLRAAQALKQVEKVDDWHDMIIPSKQGVS